MSSPEPTEREQIVNIARDYVLSEFLEGVDAGELENTTPLISAGLLSSLATTRLDVQLLKLGLVTPEQLGAVERDDDDDTIYVGSLAPAEGGTATTLVGGATSVLANDTDTDLPNDTLTVTVDTDVVNGTLTLNADGTFSYTHDGSLNLADSFTYVVSDSDGGTTDTGTVTITVNVTGRASQFRCHLASMKRSIL